MKNKSSKNVLQTCRSGRASLCAVLSILFLTALFSLSPFPVLAQTDDPYLLKDTAEQSGLAQPGTTRSLPERVGEIIRIILGFIGVVFFVLIVYAGLKWMTARGKEETTGEAKKIIENAVIGLIAISIAYALTTFIMERVLN